MSYYNINVTNTLTKSSEMKLISNKLFGLSERLDNVTNVVCIFATSGQKSSHKVETVSGNVSVIARKVSKLSETLEEITALYQMAENEIIQKPEVNWKEVGQIGAQSTEAMQVLAYEAPTTMTEDRINEFLAGGYLQESNFIVHTLIEEANGLLKDGMKPIEGFQDLIGYFLQDKDFEIPVVGTFIDKIKTIDMGIGFINGFIDYVSGDKLNDTELMVEGGSEIAKNMFKALDKASMFGKDDFWTIDVLDVKGLGLDYLSNMTKNMLEAWTNGNMSVEETYYHIFGHSALETTLDTIEDVASTITYVIYEPIAGLAECMGFEPGSIYEKYSDKEGAGAVIDCMEQVKDLILENSSYEGWVNGLNIMGEALFGWMF